MFLDNANPSCLLDTPSSSRLYSGSVCGNAFLDPGEECDCGAVEVLYTHPVSVVTQSSPANLAQIILFYDIINALM